MAYDPTQLLGGDDDAAAEQMRAMADALRQRQSGLDRQGAVGLLAALTGDKRFGQMGNALSDNATQGLGDVAKQQQFLDAAPQTRLKMALERAQASKEQADLAASEKRRTALADGASPTSQNRTMLARALGMPLRPDSTGADVDDKELELAEKVRQAQEQARSRRAAEGADKYQVIADDQGNQFYVDPKNPRSKAIPIAGPDGTPLKKAGQSKPVPEQEATKIVNQIQALDAIDELEQAHGKAGTLSSLSPFGNTAGNQYEDLLKAKAGAVAAGVLPAGRETPALIEEQIKSMPGKLTGHDRATAQFSGYRKSVLENARSQIAALEAGGYSPQQIAQLKSQLSAKETTAAAGGAPVKVASIAERDKLPSGTMYVDPEGHVRRKK